MATEQRDVTQVFPSKAPKFLPIVLISTMISGTFQIFALGVLAAPLLEDLEVSRWAIGMVGATNTLVGAITAPQTGRLTDRIGPRRSILMICGLGSLGMLVMALATNIWLLGVAAVISGLPQGWCNPATNSLIGQQVPPGKRGTITGLKQSGVTIALFLSGATVPTLADLSSWKLPAFVFAGVFAFFLMMNALLLPSSMHTDDGSLAGSIGSRSALAKSTPVPRFIWQLAIYAFLMGTSSGAIGRFLPLFAEESVGMGRRSAGLLIALVGVCGVGFRITTARLAEHRVAPPRLLFVLSAAAIGTSLLLLSATTVGAWVLWPMAVLYAFGHIAWNAVVNLEIITTSTKADAGRFSGIVMLGFLFGMTVGLPVTGAIVDRTDSYQPIWVGAACLATLALLVIAPLAKAAPRQAERAT